MAGIRVGAHSLGLDVQWRYGFVGPGSVCQAAPDAVYLDVGGGLAMGLLDQHQEAGLASSTTELVFRYPAYAYDHLMLDWLGRHRDGQTLEERVWSPIMVTHYQPDFDAVVACWLVKHLIEDGEFPACAKALVEYSSAVDQGRYTVDLDDRSTAVEPLHMAYLAIQYLPVPEEVQCKNTWRLMEGIALIDLAVAQITESRLKAGKGPMGNGSDFGVGKPGVALWRESPRFADARTLLDDDYDKYLRDREGATLTETELPLSRGGGCITVKTFIFEAEPASALNRYWARADGYPYTVCPYKAVKGDGADPDVARFDRVILSLDPNWSGNGQRPSLHGLGFALEQAECRARELQAGGDTRLATPRFDDGSCTNDDPWYDGRAQEHTIVDSPRDGTLLTYEAIKSKALSRFWALPLASAEVTVMWCLGALPEGVNTTGKSIGGLQLLDQSLDAYLQASRDCEVGPDILPIPVELPPGFSLAKTGARRVRMFPEDTAPPIALLTLSVETDGATVDELMAWMHALRTSQTEAIYFSAWFRFGRHFLPQERVSAMLQELGGGESNPQERLEVGSELVLFNDQSVILKQHSFDQSGLMSTAGPQRLASYRELMIYAVFTNEAVSAFSRRTAHAIDKDGALHGTARIRSDFLIFQARYYYLYVTHDFHLRRFYQRVIDGLKIADSYTEVQSELDRLDQAEKQSSGRTMEMLLFAIGIAGVIDAILNIPYDRAKWEMVWPGDGPVLWGPGPSGWLRLGSIVLIIAVLVIYYRMSRHQSEERDSIE